MHQNLKRTHHSEWSLLVTVPASRYSESKTIGKDAKLTTYRNCATQTTFSIHSTTVYQNKYSRHSRLKRSGFFHPYRFRTSLMPKTVRLTSIFSPFPLDVYNTSSAYAISTALASTVASNLPIARYPHPQQAQGMD